MNENKEKNFISVVAYVHNDETLVEPFIAGVSQFLNSYFLNFEIIMVNDCSTDLSVVRIKDILKNDKTENMVSIINMSYYQGLEMSMNAGVDLAIGDFVYEFDNLAIDFQENLLLEIYLKSLQGFDIVSAVPQQPLDVASKLFYVLYNWGKSNSNNNKLERELFRILSRRAINRVNALSKTIPYRKALYLNCGLPCARITCQMNRNKIVFYDKQQKRNRMGLALNTLMLFTEVVAKISLYISLAFLLFAVFVGGYTVVAYFGANKPVEGWAPIMGFLSAGFAGVFVILTIIIKYVSMVLNMIFNKQSYLIESIEKVTG